MKLSAAAKHIHIYTGELSELFTSSYSLAPKKCKDKSNRIKNIQQSLVFTVCLNVNLTDN